MVILHIGSLPNKLSNGVAVAVPQHVKAQQEICESVGLVNLVNHRIEGIPAQFLYEKGFTIAALPAPFCAPDLVVFHEVYRPAYLKLYRQCKKAGIPYVIVPHGCLTKGAQSKKRLKKAVANVLLFHAFVKGASAIQYLSEQEATTSIWNQHGFIGPNGMILPKKQKQTGSSQAKKFLFIGRTDAQHKGLDLLISAAAAESSALRNHHVKICLFGPDYAGSHAVVRGLIAQNHAEELVTLNDAITGAAKEAELLSADIFIQTSRYEGLPMGILEALSYGIPCLVTRGTNLGEIIEAYDAGWVAETDTNSIADTMLKALREQDLWEQKSKNAVKLIEENYLWRKVAKDTVAEYRRIVGK